GNFSGRPMRQVSGVTGAGPLLHRAIMDVARIRAPGVLTSPAEAGAVRVAVCKLSGLQAGRFCPAIDEWVLPATQLGRCDWPPAGGRVVCPAEYAEWVSQHPADTAIALAGDRGARTPFRIVSPQDGDRYRVPPGVDARYATIALRAVGSPGAVRWSVDG